MKFGKISSVVFLLAFAFSFAEIHAQKSNFPKQIKILNNYGSIPFEDGKTIVAEVEFTGFDSDYEEYDETVGRMLHESDFRKVLRDERATIDADDKFYGYKVSKIVKFLREWIASSGYIDAEVVALGEKLPKDRMKLIFKINRGALARVSEIRFDGNTNISNEEFVENFKQCSGDGWKIFDTRKYEYYSQMCSRKLMDSKGYFEGKVNRVTQQLVAGNHIVTIAVNEGLRYRLGEIKIEGATVFTKEEILKMGELKIGDVANGKTLQEFIYDDLKKIYGDKGYVLYNAEFDPEYIKPQAEGLDGIVDILIRIDEGRLFKLAKINFTGIEKEKAAELREMFSLKDKEPYNASKIEDGVKKINEAEKFYFVDKDQDVEIWTDEESSDVYLVIKVKEIN